jgi:hypothetical protein
MIELTTQTVILGSGLIFAAGGLVWSLTNQGRKLTRHSGMIDALRESIAEMRTDIAVTRTIVERIDTHLNGGKDGDEIN